MIYQIIATALLGAMFGGGLGFAVFAYVAWRTKRVRWPDLSTLRLRRFSGARKER